MTALCRMPPSHLHFFLNSLPCSCFSYFSFIFNDSFLVSFFIFLFSILRGAPLDGVCVVGGRGGGGGRNFHRHPSTIGASSTNTRLDCFLIEHNNSKPKRKRTHGPRRTRTQPPQKTKKHPKSTHWLDYKKENRKKNTHNTHSIRYTPRTQHRPATRKRARTHRRVLQKKIQAISRGPGRAKPSRIVSGPGDPNRPVRFENLLTRPVRFEHRFLT